MKLIVVILIVIAVALVAASPPDRREEVVSVTGYLVDAWERATTDDLKRQVLDDANKKFAEFTAEQIVFNSKIQEQIDAARRGVFTDASN